MVLTVEQRLQIAMVYEKAAADNMSAQSKVVSHACSNRSQEGGGDSRGLPAKLPDEPHPEADSQERGRADEGWTPKAEYQTLAERLKTARAAGG
jgi:hypothetical protein